MRHMIADSQQKTDNEVMDILQAAKVLGRALRRRSSHVVSVSVCRHDPKLQELDLFVDVDSKDIVPSLPIPEKFHGHKVYVRIVGTPRFAAESAKTSAF